MSDQTVEQTLRFTTRASTVMSIAAVRARDFGHSYLGTEHLLLALIDEGGGIAASALSQVGVTDDLRRLLVDAMKSNAGGRSQEEGSSFSPT